MADAQENNYLPAISAMNDLLEKYPLDQRLAYLAGDWLMGQTRYEQAVTVLERAVALYPDYAAALNDLAYGYADLGNFDKAFATMDRYVALEPDQPNPHDSYGEILRMAGKFDAALEQYRMSIRIDPNFGSEVGVADTYAVMGREREAREEYDRAIVFAPSNADKVQRELQSAVTWIRDNNRKQAERALSDVARHAHSAGLAQLEAEAHRILGMYEADPKAAMKHLQTAEDVLHEEHQISASDRDEEQARILRVRVTRLIEIHDMDAASKCAAEVGNHVRNDPQRSDRALLSRRCRRAAGGSRKIRRRDSSFRGRQLRPGIYAAFVAYLQQQRCHLSSSGDCRETFSSEPAHGRASFGSAPLSCEPGQSSGAAIGQIPPPCHASQYSVSDMQRKKRSRHG